MSELAPYEGDIEGVLLGDVREILQELIAVIDATSDRSIKLTKSGIPPKPLWKAVNERLLWADPESILYDWDEVDQVRFVYGLATGLTLVQPDAERILDVGPGADQFYFASPSRRAEMLLRAYVGVDEWDERCDARNHDGHRHNFGQTFRRDFLVDSSDLRQALLDALALSPDDAWVRADTLAMAITAARPELLISEDDDVPETPKGESDTEIRRLTEYWLYVAARFGLVDLARTPEVDLGVGGDRLFRVNELGRRLLDGTVGDVESAELQTALERKPFIVQPNNEVVFYREEADVGDEYLLRRIAEDPALAAWDEPVATYTVTRASVQRAVESGLDPTLLRERLLTRTRAEVPSTFRVLIEDVERSLGRLVLSQGLTAVELAGRVPRKKLESAGIAVFDSVAVVPWRLWGEFVRILGEEPTEGFRYPPEEPLARFEGNDLELVWPTLPAQARDLLVALELDGDPLTVQVDDAALARAAQHGWSPRAVAEALGYLTDGQLPKKLKAELK